MLDALGPPERFWNKNTASYGVMCVTEIKLTIEDVNCDYYHLLLQLLCVFYKWLLFY